MHIFKWRITGVALGVIAMNALTLILAPVGYTSNLNCRTMVNHTAAGAHCERSSTWRLRIDCAKQGDYVSEWYNQNGELDA